MSKVSLIDRTDWFRIIDKNEKATLISGFTLDPASLGLV